MRHLVLVCSLFFALAAVGQNVPVPYISEPLSPTTEPPGSQGFTLTVHGANFAPSAVLEWNGSQRPTSVISGSILQAPVYTSDLTVAGFALVTVVNLGNNPQTSNTALFTVRNPAPATAFAQDPYFTGVGDIGGTGDFNGDGIPDVVTCGSIQGQKGSFINVYLGQGRNKFGPAITTAAKDVIRCESLFTGDFNGDHLLDLAVAGTDHVAMWFGDGKGKFTEGPDTQLGTYSHPDTVYGVADFDGDGILDLLITNFYEKSVFVLFGTGDGNFGSSVGVPIKKVAGNPIFGDFNEDGLLDVAASGHDGFAVCLNKGNRTFSYPGNYPLTCTGVATADVNHDGHLDIVDCNGAVLLGKGNGGFRVGSKSNYAGSGLPIIADFNGNGNMDLLFLNNPVPQLLVGNGDGTFQPAAPAGSISPPGFYGLSDFNTDGHVAMVANVPAYKGAGITVFRQISAGLYPGILTYSPQLVGTSSPPQTATLYNAQNSTPLNLNSIGIGGPFPNDNDFTQTNNCPNSLPVGGSCQIQVTFTPTAAGNRQAALVVGYQGSTSPQTVTLTGKGLPGLSVSLTPSSLTYALQLVNTTSAPQAATLTNTGSGDITISNIGVSGEFAQTNNCPSILPVGQSCQIQVTFSPTQKGQGTGTLSVSDNAPNSPQTVALSGVGTVLVFRPIGVNFGDQMVGTNSQPVNFNFINEGTVALSISSISFGGADPQDFSQTNNCPSSLPAGKYCTIAVTFTPTQKGARSASIQVFDDATPSPQTAGVGGTGT